VTVREKAPTILTAEGARRITARIRDALSVADDLLVQAYEGLAWEALGHDSWAAYCAAELPELRMVKLRAPERRARVHALRDAGASIPEIVAATGSSLGTVHRDLTPTTPAPFQMESPRRVSGYRAAVELVTAQGAAGLTCIELCERTGWRGGQATGALSKAHSRGLIRPAGTFRDGCTVYVSSENRIPA
jgi:hypothetical protein